VVESFDPRVSIPETLGPVRRAILEGLIDGEGALSVSQLHALMPVGTPRGTTEAGILREYRSGRIERIAAGTYILAKPTPPEPKPKPASHPTPEDEAIWFDALERWAVDPASWNVEELGPRPNEPDNKIPPDIRMRFADRLRKRQERRREAEAAATARAAADAELRDPLIAATGGNLIRGPGIEDVSPIQLALQVVPLERVLSAIRYRTDRKMFPKNEPARSWSEESLLREIAENYSRADLVPRLVDAWSKAGKAPTPGAQSSPPTGEMPDDHIDRSCHDQENAPSGPHVMPQPPMDEDAGAAPSVAPDVSANAADASDAPPAVSAPLES
jgi:hypothetical protein